MAALHSALKSLAPCNFSDIPHDQADLDPFLADLFLQVQSIVESIPIPDPDPSLARTYPHDTRSNASKASEMNVSSARSQSPPPEYASLQKEWGKPIKLSAKENPMGIAVYKLASKDNKGSWFARRSVHQGLGFSRFKHGFEREFPTSLSVQGAPGEGNVRGIGAETRVEEIHVPNKGTVEVYRLSAQFPGPTTPRDFVTLLVTSSKAMKHHKEDAQFQDLLPRHYMIISKPCNHPDTQPRSGYIRGQYESVEFIREIPRALKSTTSSTDLSRLGHHRTPSTSLERDVLKHNAEKRDGSHGQHDQPEQSHGRTHLRVDPEASANRDLSPASRKRSATVAVPRSPVRTPDPVDHYEPEDNPVEWIMVTRSDPGGSVPRFMVERGTPSSICSDAWKFLDWACQRDEEDDPVDGADPRPAGHRRESFARWEANGTLSGIQEHEQDVQATDSSPSPAGTGAADAVVSREASSDSLKDSPPRPGTPSSPVCLLYTVAETIDAYTPQVVRDHLPNATPKGSPRLGASQGGLPVDRDGGASDDDKDDGSSTISSTSFASADSHLVGDIVPSISSKSLSSQTESQLVAQHDKELAKLSERKAAMDARFTQQKQKLLEQANKETEREQHALHRAEAKHERELKKHEERYHKEVGKLEQRRKKEARKLAEKQRKQQDKDEKSRLTRERDEARAELELLRKEQDIYVRQVGELQRENTALMARIGKLEGGDSPIGTGKARASTLTHEGRNRSSTFLNRIMNKSEVHSEAS